MIQLCNPVLTACQQLVSDRSRYKITASLVLALAATCASLAFSFEPIQAGDRPNIVILFADDMGYSDIGCFGSEIDTPHLDALARDGLLFTHFYNTGRCCPSRASIITGLYPHQADIGHMAGDTGTKGYRDRLSPNSVTIPEVLGESGYHTIMTGKWHLGWRDEGCPTARGFKHFYGTRGYIDSYFTIVPRTEMYLNDKMVLPVTDTPVNHLHPENTWYTTDVFTDYALHFIHSVRQQNDDPFFLYLAYNAPHFPLHARAEDVKKYRGRYRDGWQKKRQQRYEKLVDRGIVDANWRLSPPDSPNWNSLSRQQQDDMDFKMSLFAAIVDRLDQNIGRVIQTLREMDELDNTLILFVSDNGGTKETGLFGIKGETNTVENYDQWSKVGGWTSSYGQGWANLSNVPFRLYKRFNHEGGISAPMIVHWPKRLAQPGRVTHQVSHLVDVMATCVDVAGAEYPVEFNGQEVQAMEGVSLLPVIDGTEIGDRRLYWEHEGHRAIRDGRWKLVGVHDQPWELYDMSADRSELNDLSRRHPELAKQMSGRWQTWADRVGVLPPEEVKRRRQEWNRKQNASTKTTRIRIESDPNNLATFAKVTFSTPQIGRDQAVSIQDSVLPKSSADKQTVHRSWWPEKGPTPEGGQHWAEYHFDEIQAIDNASVYWFHDHPDGGCKVPARWRLMYREDETWKPVESIEESVPISYPVNVNQWNRIQFRPVRTNQIRLQVWLQDGFSAGLHEWRIDPSRPK